MFFFLKNLISKAEDILSVDKPEAGAEAEAEAEAEVEVEVIAVTTTEAILIPGLT